MEPVIEALFYNRYRVQYEEPVFSEYNACAERLNRYYDRIKAELGDSFFRGFYDAEAELEEREHLYFFHKGIQLGGQAVLALLSEPAL